MRQQIVSYEELFGHIKTDGVYLCEDLHTSYWIKYGGGYKRRNTFIEYSKYFIDYLNAYHSEQKALKVNYFTRSVDSIHYYDSIIVIEKKQKEAPFDEQTGTFSFDNSPKKIFSQKDIKKLILVSLTLINKILRFFRLPGFIWR